MNIGFVPCSPLGRGFLTGDTRPASEYPAHDMRSWDDRWHPGNFAAVEQLRALAATKEISVGQLALAWLLAVRSDRGRWWTSLLTTSCHQEATHRRPSRNLSRLPAELASA